MPLLILVSVSITRGHSTALPLLLIPLLCSYNSSARHSSHGPSFSNTDHYWQDGSIENVSVQIPESLKAHSLQEQFLLFVTLRWFWFKTE